MFLQDLSVQVLTKSWQFHILLIVDLPVGQMVKTPPSQGGVTSSILVRVI